MGAFADTSTRRALEGDTIVSKELVSLIGAAATDKARIAGWTHNFYRYPARFSPQFAAKVIECFSPERGLVVDPYMGGGTSVVEALAANRRVVGNDLNALAVFIAKVKTTALSVEEESSLRAWTEDCVPSFTYARSSEELLAFVDSARTKNLSLPRARFIKKAIACALSSLGELPTKDSRDFARCALLRVAQWALDGREAHTSLREFRKKLASTTLLMLDALRSFTIHTGDRLNWSVLINGDAAQLAACASLQAEKADLVVTSPPYPGVHVLYHRWQVDGRRETPAPYWITGQSDGQGASFYNFGDRKEAAADRYFETSLKTLNAVREVTKDGGFMVQLVAFSQPKAQLSRYLNNMAKAGFREMRTEERVSGGRERIWRDVPSRKWHAALSGRSESAREVVLIHRAD
jgi:hypothetical protein